MDQNQFIWSGEVQCTSVHNMAPVLFVPFNQACLRMLNH